MGRCFRLMKCLSRTLGGVKNERCNGTSVRFFEDKVSVDVNRNGELSKCLVGLQFEAEIQYLYAVF